MKTAFPAFRPRAPWWGPDLQTLRNALRGAPDAIWSAERRELVLPLDDGTGDALSTVLDLPLPGDPRPLVVLVHGLSGSHESAYMIASADYWLARGHPVLRVNLRGAGPSRAHCRLQYHAGRTGDLRHALDALLAREPAHTREGLVLVGYSLGGNMVLKFLAEHGAALPLRAAASVSAPIDLAAASQRFLAPRNRLYHRHLLRTLQSECFGGRAEVSAREAEAVLSARTIYEFDERFVAPRNGYRDALHYYAENAAQGFLEAIRVPTLVIHALDDPWIPSEAYVLHPWSRNPNVQPLLAPGGGHVGFHDRASKTTWHDRCIGIFYDEVGAGSPGRAARRTQGIAKHRSAMPPSA